jgi:hypothetical protein
MATFVPALVVVCTRFCLIARVDMELFVLVLGVLTVDATGLEVLVFALGETLPVVAFIVAATAIVAELALLGLAMLTTMVAAIASIIQPVAPTLVGKMMLPMCILFLQLAA